MLISFGCEEEAMKVMAGTGLVVDIEGQAEEAIKGPVKCLALRADMDALPIPENNPDLPYKTQT
jgi:metal-dependent amidase/aminoacylase/carboxypeptidase family protein